MESAIKESNNADESSYASTLFITQGDLNTDSQDRKPFEHKHRKIKKKENQGETIQKKNSNQQDKNKHSIESEIEHERKALQIEERKLKRTLGGSPV